MSAREDGEFTGTAGRVSWRAWLPASPAVGVVVIVHGVAEHSGRYDYLGTRLADAGYAVYAGDHHGHGKSSGSAANIGRMHRIARDVDQMLGVATTLTPGRPRFLIGHSMGALTTLFLTITTPLDLAGVVLSATPLILPPVNPLTRRLAPVLSAIAPRAGALKLDSLDISRDMAVVRDYDTDPLNYRGKLPVRTGAEMMKAVETVKKRLGSYSYPTLLLHGSDDKIADPAAVTLIRGGVAPGTDLTVKVYTGLYHEVFNEPERDEVIGDVIAWLDDHLPAAETP
jgi:alpha-beta hydrolase superfamily lysophospholipase